MIIDSRRIGSDSEPYIIAEISANHNGSLSRALELIQAAKRAGASAVKLQTYTADTLTIKSSGLDFQIRGGLWNGRTLHDLYQQAHTPWEWHRDLFEAAADAGITIFSSPFDSTAIDLLEKLNAPAYKIASFEIVDHDLIRRAASTGKPLIISTGLANFEEIQEAYQIAIEAGADGVALLHCLSSYPAPPSEYKLGTISALKKSFDCEIGLSDHTIGNDIAIASVALGATIIEKHFTWDSDGGGPDDSFSMDPAGLTSLRNSVNAAWQSMGFDNYRVQPSEVDNIRFRRSLYFVSDIVEGQEITHEHIRAIRPGYGIAPRWLPDLIGRKSTTSASRGDRVTAEFLESILSKD